MSISSKLGELLAADYYHKQGWNVYTPVGDDLPHDLLIERDGIYLRIQVKTCAHRGQRGLGHYLISLPGYDGDAFDILFAVAGGQKWEIPIDEVAGKRTLTLGPNLALFRLD
jgi:hypothetical protein